MIEQAIAYVESLIQQYGALGVFAGTLIEEIVAPIPSALVPLAGGFALIAPDVPVLEAATRSLLVVALPVACGIAIGSSLVYAIAHFGGKPVVDRYSGLLGLTWADVERMQARFTRGRGDELALLGLRLLPVVPGVAISGFCGAVRYPYPRFLAITLLGSFIRAFALGLVGWQAGELYLRYLDTIDRFEHLILGGLFVLVLAAIAWHFARRHR